MPPARSARSSKNHLGICIFFQNPFVLLVGDPGEQIPVQVKNASEMGQEAGKVGALRPGANIKTEANAKLFQGLVHYVLPR